MSDPRTRLSLEEMLVKCGVSWMSVWMGEQLVNHLDRNDEATSQRSN